MKFLFTIFLLINKIIYLSGYIVLPIELLKKENIISPYSPNSPKDIIYNEQCNSFITELEIGTPPQKIPFLVTMKTDDFVISSINPMKKNASDYYLSKDLYDLSPNFFKKYNFFNENKSNTFSSKICEDRRKKYHKYDDDWPIAEETCSSYDTFHFYKNIDMKSKIEEKNMYFDLVRSIKDNITGVIGLSIYEKNKKESNFLFLLKKNNISENYYWFFDFDSPKNEKGKLIIGSTLDKIYVNQYENKVLEHLKGGSGNLYWNVKFNKVFINNSTEKIYFDENSEFNYDTNIIGADYKYKNYFKLLIEDLYNEGKCFNDTFNGCRDFYRNGVGEWIFVYCKNEKEVKEKLNRLILPIKFYSSELNYTFEITNDDILKENGEYIFIKILFQRYGGNWFLGKPFTLKYKFMFNPDIKEIGFYSTDINIEKNDNNEKDSNFKKIFISILVIIGLCIICVIVGVILGKKLYGLKRKKRANEMADDNYEYFSENQKKKDENKLEFGSYQTAKNNIGNTIN